MSATAGQVLDSARTHLNDDNAINWQDTRLFPKLQEAYREMMASLLYSGVPLVHQVNNIMTVPAMSVDDDNVDLSTIAGYPTDMIIPVWIKERSPGQLDTDFVDMTEVDYIPNITKSTDQLVWWSWMGQTIWVLGALTDVEIQIRYNKNLTPPVTVNDPIVVTQGETFLSYRTAALAAGSSGNTQLNQFLSTQADRNLLTVVNISVKQLQNLPAKRRAYHRGRGRSRVIRDF